MPNTKDFNDEVLVSTFEYKNDVTIVGRIVHIHKGPKMNFVSLRTFTKTTNYPQVRFYRDKSALVKDFKVGDVVCVRGRVSSTKNKQTGVPEQYIVGSAIETAVPILQQKFGAEFDGRVRYSDDNYWFTSAKVAHVTRPTDNVANYLLYTETEGRVSVFKVVHYLYGAKPFAKGDLVAGYGTIQTVKKSREDGNVYFTDYIVSEMKKISE